MRIFGMNNFGWRLSSVLIVVFSIPGFYFLVKNLFDKKTAVFSTIIFISSFYFYAYARIGYSNIQAILPCVYALFFLTRTRKKTKKINLFVAGVFAGLGWYTFYTSRIVFPFCFCYLLSFLFFKKDLKKEILSSFVFLSSGFLLSVLPLFLSDGMDVFRQMTRQSILNIEYLDIYVGNPVKRFLVNYAINFVAFFWGEKQKHFLITPLFDPLSQIFIFWGFLSMIMRRKMNGLFVLIAYVLSITMVAFNPIGEISVSRLQISILLLAIIGGVGWKFFEGFVGNWRTIFPKFLNLYIFLFLLFLNLRISYFLILQKYSAKKESLIIKAIQESKLSVVIDEGEKENVSFRQIVDAYGLAKKTDYINEEDDDLPNTPFLFLENSKENSQILEKNSSLPCQNGVEVSITGFKPEDIIGGIVCR